MRGPAQNFLHVFLAVPANLHGKRVLPASASLVLDTMHEQILCFAKTAFDPVRMIV